MGHLTPPRRVLCRAFAVPGTHPIFAGTSFFGRASVAEEFVTDRLVTNGTRVDGWAITGGEVYINIDAIMSNDPSLAAILTPILQFDDRAARDVLYPVPEPGSLALLGWGTAAWMFVCRRAHGQIPERQRRVTIR